MLKFIDPFIKGLIDLPPDHNLGIERAHRSLQRKPTNPMDPPRSIIVKFSSFQIKENVLHRAWKKKKLEFKGKRIFLDHDHSNSLQNKKREYIEIKKQLKQQEIRFQSRYPNKLKVFLKTGAVVFNSAWEAADGLRGHGINCKVSEAELARKELHGLGRSAMWDTRSEPELKHQTIKDIIALFGKE